MHIIREWRMCQPDLSLYPWYWKDDNYTVPRLGRSSPRICVNYEEIQDWQSGRRVSQNQNGDVTLSVPVYKEDGTLMPDEAFWVATYKYNKCC